MSNKYKCLETSYNTIIISGGGIKGFGALGIIQFLYDQKQLKNIEEFVGTSIGSIISYLLCIGYTPIEIMVSVVTSEIIEKYNCIDILSLTNGQGAFDWSHINNFLEKMTIDKIGRFVTLGDISKLFNKNLIICTYNFTKRKIEYISSKDTPDIPSLTAIRMSCNLPIIFNKYKYMNCYYMDGGICNNLPTDTIKDSDYTIVINLRSKNNERENNEIDSMPFHEFIYEIFFSAINQNIDKSINLLDHKNCDLITLEVQQNSLNFKVTKQSKFEIFSQGYEFAKKFYLEPTTRFIK